MQENPLDSAVQAWLAPWQQAQQFNLALMQSCWQGWQQLAACNPWLTPFGGAAGMAGVSAFTELAGSLLQGLPLAASVAPVAGDPQAARVSLRLGLPRGFSALGCMGPAEWLQVEALVAHRQEAGGAKLVSGEVLPTTPRLEGDA